MDTESANKPSYLPFTREAAKYFMDFLETNFHKQRLPKRSISSRNSQNLLVGLSLKKYENFCRQLWKELDDFSGQISRLISPGQFTAPIPTQTLRLIEQQASLIENSQLERLHDRLISLTYKHALAHDGNVEQTVQNAAIASSELIRQELVRPFVEQIEAPLLSLSRNEVEAVLDAENTLTEIIYSGIHNGIADSVRSQILHQEYDLATHLRTFCSSEGCQKTILDFFSEFSVSDLAFDLQELSNNNRILDKQELYLYIGEITFEKVRYPIIYTPVRIEKQASSYSLIADSPFFVNKKAISYVVQQFNTQTGRHGGQELITERILYPAEFHDQVSVELQRIVNNISDYFELTPHVNLTELPAKKIQGLFVSISPELRFAIFDKSDESLINDYEEILSLIDQEAPITEDFAKLIEDFLTKDPPSFISETEEIWHDKPMPERVAFSSPVALNAEQRQILIALNNPKCRYLAIEGPPGTGKSHTITALVCNAVLQKKSVLILSDKTEALDVVEDKITHTLNSVRIADEFQNPILRLGKSGNTYNKILAATSIQKIRDHYRTARNKSEQIETQRKSIESDLTTTISETASALSAIRLSEIQKLYELESNSGGNLECVSYLELVNSKSPPSISNLRQCSVRLSQSLSDSDFQDIHKRVIDGPLRVNSLASTLKFLHTINVKREEKREHLSSLKLFSAISQSQAEILRKVIADYNELTSGLFRHLFKKSRISRLNNTLRSGCRLTTPADLKKDVSAYTAALGILDSVAGVDPNIERYPLIHGILSGSIPGIDESRIGEIEEDLDCLKSFTELYPISAKSAEICRGDIKSYIENAITQLTVDEAENIDRRVKLTRDLSKKFTLAPDLNFSEKMSALSDFRTHEMAHLLDGRVLKFSEEYRNTSATLKDIIKKKKRFPKDLFLTMRDAFPCIIAGIRDYADYIPLESELFDVVVIDEASQVSIAQAFPALLRGKQIVIFGDSKQFSNVKSAHARSDKNTEWRNRLKTTFIQTIDHDAAQLERSDKFNIKTSVLEFFEHVSNFSIMLRKYFRGYPEHISYSNKHFYGNNIQAIRIRTRPIAEVIRFTILNHDGLSETTDNTNSLEAQTIIEHLVELKKQNSQMSVGIITPHTNQQKLLMSLIGDHPERDYFFETLRLKVMTFDTCQGEERDLVFYSMVASPTSDKLWAIFVKDLALEDLEENGKIKAQRLNVGFSRAKECMHFVLSKPIEDFRGAIGEALRHYSLIGNAANDVPSEDDVDSRSPMEKKVLQWILRTQFYRENAESMVVRAQFPIGETLRQLDPLYQHPQYKVDFLIVVTRPDAETCRMVLEYDGFEFHFREHEFVTDLNYDQYYSEDDVERQLILESYGYRFIRLNRFNCGQDPVAFLDSQIAKHVKKKALARQIS